MEDGHILDKVLRIIFKQFPEGKGKKGKNGKKIESTITNFWTIARYHFLKKKKKKKKKKKRARNSF